ncbi:MAG: hybrid sensor histidine kinase/response regulator [Acidobacteriota bacterium]
MSDTPSADILVVDDTPANLQVLVGLLKERGYAVRPVTSGPTALRAAMAAPPDLILLDISMPDMDGYAVCRELKRTPLLADIPVVFLSAHTDAADKVSAFAAGGVDYVTKPFCAEEVVARVQTHLRLRARERQLRESYNRLRELEGLRDNLVHMIVHDLRSPLTAILGNVELLDMKAGGTAHPDVVRVIGELGAAGNQMLRIVNSVLDVGKLEAGRMRLRLTECDVAGIVREALANLAPLVGRRWIHVDEPGATGARVDRDLMVRVMQNLLANAMKFTSDGGEIHIAITSSEREVTVKVSDDGPGVPVEFRNRIFDKYGALGSAGSRAMFSTGLGLPFCKMAVEAHGGRIGVDGEVGKGSTFWWTLPRNVGRNAGEKEAPAHGG